MRFSGEQVRLVTLLKKSTTYNSHNEPVETWAADETLFEDGLFYAEVWDQGGKEFLESGQIIAQKDIRLKCRYITGLNESDYMIRLDSGDYDIESIKEIGRKDGQMLMLKKPDNK